MTEAEWAVCQETSPMLNLLRRDATDRKIRLLCLACCYRLSDVFRVSELNHALKVADQLIEGESTPTERKAARRAASAVVSMQPLACAAWAVQRLLKKKTVCLADDILPSLADARRQETCLQAVQAGVPVGGAADHVWFAEQRAQCDIIRDIFGNPFRPITFDPSWLSTNVVSLARQMYDSRDFSAMPILADALQDAGCDNADVLNHCQQPGEHVRGCWLVDALLAKG
jgi:hypothetical protein